MVDTLGVDQLRLFSCLLDRFAYNLLFEVMVVSHVLDHYPQNRPKMMVVSHYLDHYRHSCGESERKRGAAGGLCIYSLHRRGIIGAFGTDGATELNSDFFGK